MSAITAHRRPRYAPTKRLAILEVRAARGWSLKQTADVFLVTPATVVSWSKRVDELGPKALLQLREPVNRFPDFVRQSVQRLKIFCLHDGQGQDRADARTRWLAPQCDHGGSYVEGTAPHPAPKRVGVSTGRVVTAKRPNHVWHLDLTTVPTVSGFWASWLPFAVPQCWPFCWWVGVAIDHYSRRVIAVTVFPKKLGLLTVSRFMGSVIGCAGSTPNYLVCDKDKIFWCETFKGWCDRKRIKPRYGAVGKRGSIAVVERAIRTMKDECTRRILVPQRRKEFRRELLSFMDWYNEYRPHMTLEGSTPNEIYFGRCPANQCPRLEPRKRWPRVSLCARPRTPVAGHPGDRFGFEVNYFRGCRHLPIVSLKRAA